LKPYLIIVFLLCILKINAQTYTYSYTDPCSGKLKTINVPINGTVTVSYYGEVSNFSANDFSNGAFENWTSSVIAQYKNISPCSQTVGVSTTVSVTQSQVINTISVLGSLSSLADIAGATNILGGTTSTLSGTNNTDNNNGNSSNSNRNSNNGSSSSNGSVSTNPESNPNGTQTSSETPTSTSSNPGGSQGSETTGGGSGTTSGGETTGGSGTTSGGTTGGGSGGSGSGGNGGSSGSGGEETTTQTTETTPQETGGKTNITAGSTNTIKSSTTTTSSSKGKDGGNGRPAVVASSDFVGFNFKNSDVSLGVKLTGGYTALRWDGKRSWGGLLDYTSALKGPNVTGFYAWLKNKNVALMSATLTLGFEGVGSIYGTVSGGYMQSFKKIKHLKMVYMGTASYGQVFRTKFLGTAVIVGGMFDFKVGDRLAVKLTDLMVYSPYVSYYNDIVMKSPYVMLPSIGVNVGITKKFKFNINGGGAWSLGQSTLNYTVTCGTRLMIGAD
jgi:hypothetical protein